LDIVEEKRFLAITVPFEPLSSVTEFQ